MHLLIFGASGRTGKEIVSQALAKGYEITAFLRDPAKMERKEARFHTIQGDVLIPEDVNRACSQIFDGVICAIGSSSASDKHLRAIGTRHIVEAMQRHLPGVRLWVVSTVGVSDSLGQIAPIPRLMMNTVLRATFQDHEEQEALVRASGLPFTIVRPTGLTDGCRSGDYQVEASGPLRSQHIKRADVADFILSNLSNQRYLEQAVSITG